MSKKKKRIYEEVDHLVKVQEGAVAMIRECLDDAAERATLCFLADQDEAAYLFRDQLKRFRRLSEEANSLLCDLLLELNGLRQ
jgi:hypothetical protein